MNNSTSESTISPAVSDVALPDYTSMVREAIASVSMAVTEGCSRFHIVLYILNKYKPSENINTIHTKVRTALALLRRLGIIDKMRIDGVGENTESDLEEEDHLRSRPEPTPSPKGISVNPFSASLAEKKKVTKNILKHNASQAANLSVTPGSLISP